MLTPAQVRAQVTAIRKRMTNGARAFALQAQGAWTGPDTLEVSGLEHRVIPCQSDLQMREALLACDSDERPCILLCTFNTEQLGDDVLARLAKRRVIHPQTTEVLAEFFGARVLDPRVLACKPLVEALIARAPREGYPPVTGGSLDLQTAWLTLLEQVFEERWDAPTLVNLLGWSFDERRIRAFAELSPPLRDAFVEWMAQTAGPAARLILAALSAGVGRDLIPLGLLLDLLFQPECRGVSEAQVAQGRLEQSFGSREIDETGANAWATAAGELLCLRAAADKALARRLLAALDRWIEQVRLSTLAIHSRFSPSGLEAQFHVLGRTLSASLASSGSASLDRLAGTLRDAERHFLAPEHSARLRRVRMALRLLAWLETARVPEPTTTFTNLAEYYVKEGGFVDWARDSLSESDPAAPLRKAYQEILERVEHRFGAFEEAFITALQRWFADGSPGEAVLPIEDVLHRLAGPAARQQPVLLLVLDGMSVTAFRQLLDDLLRRDWVEVGHRAMGIPRPVAATLPSVTEISRWALLAGRLDINRRSSERAEFSGNQKLAELAGGPVRPQLFVKGDLSSSDQLGLAAEVSAAILNPKCRIVGVVVNAMDDLLAASDQVALGWDIDSIKPLRELLYAAREAERIVLVTSDHGHVLDTNSLQLSADGEESGDRYRAASGPLQQGEVQVTGRRIEQGLGRQSVVCLARKNLRYQSKKRGYHGGACVQEVIVPVAALRHVACPLPDGWEDLPPFEPPWWREGSPSAAQAPAAPPALTRREPPMEQAKPELDLFAHAARRLGQPSPDWLSALFATELYREQVTRAARGAPPAELMGRLLKALETCGGSMLRGALAQELGLPLFRIDGLIQSAGRILNLDGYEVISYDRTSETVCLNLGLLKSQFEIE